jgi:hypothetical protein
MEFLMALAYYPLTAITAVFSAGLLYLVWNFIVLLGFHSAPHLSYFQCYIIRILWLFCFDSANSLYYMKRLGLDK